MGLGITPEQAGHFVTNWVYMVYTFYGQHKYNKLLINKLS